VRNLPLPARDLVRKHLTITLKVYERSGKQYGYPATEDEISEVIGLYDGYDAADGSPNDVFKGSDLDAALRKAILEGYDLTGVGRRLASIRTDLFQGVERCPICGISAPRVLDHHLPKSNYNPLAIYVRNLVPLCVDCNLSKGAAASALPAEQFIHPYFEKLPNERFLRAHVSVQNGGLIAEFGLDPAVQLPALLAARLD
jgi:hypothetical protein